MAHLVRLVREIGSPGPFPRQPNGLPSTPLPARKSESNLGEMGGESFIMYSRPTTTVVTTGLVGGTLAATGLPVIGLTVLGFMLILLGFILLRTVLVRYGDDG